MGHSCAAGNSGTRNRGRTLASNRAIGQLLPSDVQGGSVFATAPRLCERIRMDTHAAMNTFLRTDDFDAWLVGLKDNLARARIVHRIRSAEHGNFGD